MAKASVRKIRRTSRLRAPRALRTPISRVRSKTAISIVFAIPKKATTSPIPPNTARRPLMKKNTHLSGVRMS